MKRIFLVFCFFPLVVFAQKPGIEATFYEAPLDSTVTVPAQEPVIADTLFDPDRLQTEPSRAEALAALENKLNDMDARLNNLYDGSVSNDEIVKTRINNELLYVVILCCVALSSLLIVLYFLRSKTYTSKDVVSVTGLTLIIFGTIILVLIVDTSEQLTAAIGVLGAIAGYLFRSVQESSEGGQKA